MRSGESQGSAPMIKVLGDVERDEGGQPLSIGWALVDVDAAIVRLDGLVPGGLVMLQVVQRHQAALFLQRRHDGFGNWTGVESFRPALGDGAQGIGEAGQTNHLPRFRRRAIRQVFLGIGALRRKAPECSQR